MHLKASSVNQNRNSEKTVAYADSGGKTLYTEKKKKIIKAKFEFFLKKGPSGLTLSAGGLA